jgi:cell division protein FtsB
MRELSEYQTRGHEPRHMFMQEVSELDGDAYIEAKARRRCGGFT